LLWLLTTLAYLSYARAPGPLRYLGVAGLMVLGLAAKPMLVTLPVVLLLLDAWPLGRWGQRAARVREKIPLLVLAAASGAITLWAQHEGRTIGSLESFPLGARVQNAIVSAATYLGKAAWPAGLAVYYPHPGAALPLWKVGAAAAALCAITVLALGARRRFPYLLIGWLWYLVTLLPVIGLVQVGGQARADRYTYVPLTGAFIAVAWASADGAWFRGRRTMVLPWLAVPILIALTRVQVGYWRDSESLFRRALAVTRDNAMAHWSLGSALADAGRLGEAIEQYREALGIEPGFPMALHSLGVALAAQGRNAEAVLHYQKALALRPDYTAAHRSLGHALDELDRTTEALPHYEEAVRLEPERPETRNDLAQALIRLGRPREALAQLVRAIELHPGYAKAHSNLAAAHYTLGQYEEAWLEVGLARRHGFEPPAELLRRLSAATAEPPSRRAPQAPDALR
jgi:Flp pilus assembly protein TadD